MVIRLDLPKRCACGVSHGECAWLALPLCGVQRIEPDVLEYRHCRCGSTIAVRLDGVRALAELAADAREMRRATERVEREIAIAQAGGDGAYTALLAARSALATARQHGDALDPQVHASALIARSELPPERPVLIRRAAAGDGAAVERLRNREDLAGLLTASLLRVGGLPEGSA